MTFGPEFGRKRPARHRRGAGSAGKIERRARRRRSQRARGAGRFRVARRIEGVALARGLHRARRRRRRAGRRRGGGGRGGGGGTGAAEAEFDVLLELLELIFEPTLLIFEFFDAAVGLPQFVFQPVDAHVERAGVARIGRRAGDGGGGRLGLRGLRRRGAAERVEIESARARHAEETEADNGRAGAAKARMRRQDVKPPIGRRAGAGRLGARIAIA